MTAFLLAGGLGTRLRSVVADRPKALAPVAGRPMILHLLDQLADAGITRAVLGVGHLGAQVEQLLGARYRTLDLEYSHEDTPLGTGGALRLAAERLAGAPVVVLNGDSWCDYDLPSFFAWHRAHRARVSMLLARVDDSGRFGSVDTDAHGRVIRFAEKDESRPWASPGWINAGIYLLAPDVAATIARGRPVSLEREVFPALVGAGLYAWHGGGRFIDIGTPASFADGERFFTTAPVLPSYTHRPTVVLDRDGTIIHDRHYLSDPDGVSLLPGAAEGLRRMRELGARLVVATNQSAIARGYLDDHGLARIHDRLRLLLGEAGATLDLVAHCPHGPEDACGCRKPATGMVDEGLRQLGVTDPPLCVIGDKLCDIELGAALGSATILVLTGYGAQELEAGMVHPDFVVNDLTEAARVMETLLRLSAAGVVSLPHRSSDR